MDLIKTTVNGLLFASIRDIRKDDHLVNIKHHEYVCIIHFAYKIRYKDWFLLNIKRRESVIVTLKCRKQKTVYRQ